MESGKERGGMKMECAGQWSQVRRGKVMPVKVLQGKAEQDIAQRGKQGSQSSRAEWRIGEQSRMSGRLQSEKGQYEGMKVLFREVNCLRVHTHLVTETASSCRSARQN